MHFWASVFACWLLLSLADKREVTAVCLACPPCHRPDGLAWRAPITLNQVLACWFVVPQIKDGFKDICEGWGQKSGCQMFLVPAVIKSETASRTELSLDISAHECGCVCWHIEERISVFSHCSSIFSAHYSGAGLTFPRARNTLEVQLHMLWTKPPTI